MPKNLTKNKKIPVIINCDTGIDDAVALMIAIKSEKLDIKLITTDIGNVDSKQSAKNTINVLNMFGDDTTPVCAGDGQYFVRMRPKFSAHGNGGLGAYSFDKNARRLAVGDAVDRIYQVLSSSDEKITIISISPLTNMAKLLKRYPDCVDYIERLVVMAGSTEPTAPRQMPYPEFNIATDPEAGETVFKSKLKIDIVPMEMGHTAYLSYEDVFKTKITNYVGSVLEKIYRGYKDRHVKNGVATHDGCATAYVVRPDIFKTRPVHAEVKYFKSIDSGVLTLDFEKEPNCTACVEVDVKKFINLYFKMLKKCK